MRVKNVVGVQINGVKVLEDAAHLDLWKREGFSHIFHAPRLNHRFVENLAIKIDGGAIRLNRPRMDAGDISLSF